MVKTQVYSKVVNAISRLMATFHVRDMSHKNQIKFSRNKTERRIILYSEYIDQGQFDLQLLSVKRSKKNVFKKNY